MDKCRSQCGNNNIFYKQLHGKILVAVSGGQDSLYLIKLLENSKITREKKIHISYIYIDHQWRKDSNRQVKHIINYIKSLNTTLYIYQFRETAISENICRIYRYSVILRHAIMYGYKNIITGHNKTDKMETFLHRFFRGYGIEGITTLSSQVKLNYNVKILRPLLNIHRNHIYWTCKKFYLPIWSDTTNYLYSISRNRIRNELIPYLKKYFHNNIENNISYLLHNYYINHEYIKQNTLKLYLSTIHNNYVAINCLKLTKQQFVLQFKVVQLFWIHNTNTHIDYKTITGIILHINQKNKISLHINIKHVQINIGKKWIYITV